MSLLDHALRGAQHGPPVQPGLLPRVPALVVGGGGVLGAAILAECLVAGRFQQVQVLTSGPIASALRGFQPVSEAQLVAEPAPAAAGIKALLRPDVAFLVFERQRHANGRDEAFVQPQPPDLLPLARAVRQAGVRALLVVLPHAPALLPHALKSGFAGADEAAVAALGFEHLVLVRAAQAARPQADVSGLQRFANWWLQQLSWMVPTREQPVRAVRLAQLLVHLAQRLPAHAPGTRVLPPEVLWQAAQADSSELVLDAWLARGAPR